MVEVWSDGIRSIKCKDPRGGKHFNASVDCAAQTVIFPYSCDKCKTEENLIPIQILGRVNLRGGRKPHLGVHGLLNGPVVGLFCKASLFSNALLSHRFF